MSELVIRGGTVIDGTGAPGVVADVAIDGGRITAIGTELSGDRVLDATGHVVAPGFIDIHTHYDAQVFWDPSLTPSCFHGVTTIVAGNCGFSIAPTRPEHHSLIARTLENVEDMDVATLEAGVPVGFLNVSRVFGLGREPRDGAELRGLRGSHGAAAVRHGRRRVRAGGDAGRDRSDAGGRRARRWRREPPASRPASRRPTAASTASRCRAGSPSGPRSWRCSRHSVRPASGSPPSHRASRSGVAELYELQPKIGVPFTYTALLTDADRLPPADAGAEPQGLGRRRAGLAAGFAAPAAVLDVARGTLHPQRQPEVCRADVVGARQAARGVRRSGLAPGHARSLGERLAVRPAALGHLRDRRVGGAPGARRPAACARSPRSAVWSPSICCSTRRSTSPTSACGSAASWRTTILTRSPPCSPQPGCTLGLSDAGAHVGQLCDAPQATDYLGNWVRDRSLTSLEEAVAPPHRLPGRPSRAGRPWPAGAGSLGRRRRLRPRDRGPGAGAPGRRLPHRLRAADGRRADRDPPRPGQRHAHPRRRGPGPRGATGSACAALGSRLTRLKVRGNLQRLSFT